MLKRIGPNIGPIYSTLRAAAFQEKVVTFYRLIVTPRSQPLFLFSITNYCTDKQYNSAQGIAMVGKKYRLEESMSKTANIL